MFVVKEVFGKKGVIYGMHNDKNAKRRTTKKGSSEICGVKIKVFPQVSEYGYRYRNEVVGGFDSSYSFRNSHCTLPGEG